jgi:hypothetical protein
MLERLSVYDRPVIFLGDGADVHANSICLSENVKTPVLRRRRLHSSVCICGSVRDRFLAPPHLSLQRASAAAALGQKRICDAVAYDKFELFYLRKPQAEREYLERTRAREAQDSLGKQAAE